MRGQTGCDTGYTCHGGDVSGGQTGSDTGYTCHGDDVSGDRQGLTQVTLVMVVACPRADRV